VVNSKKENSSHDLEENDAVGKKRQGRPFGSFKGYREKSPVPIPKFTERQQKLKEKLKSAEDQGECLKYELFIHIAK
jgi:hypothetical protein